MRSLDPSTPSARQRLEKRLGILLAGKLLFALAPRVNGNRRAA
jgi:hypothetical protein